MLLAILILSFFFVAVIDIKIYPASVVFGKKREEEGLIYQIQPILSIFAKFNRLLGLSNYGLI